MGGKSTYSIDENYFKSIDTPDKSFWFGFICADGDLHNHHGLRLKIAQKDPTLLRQFVLDTKFTGDVKERKANKGSYSTSNIFEVLIYNRNFVNNLLSVGKTWYKHDLKSIPTSIPHHLRRDFIRGYFEGDGCITSSKQTYGVYWVAGINGNRGFLDSIKEHISCELFSGISTGSIRPDHSIYRLLYTGQNTVNNLMTYLYNDTNDGLKMQKYTAGRK
jgi:hypothetical protein